MELLVLVFYLGEHAFCLFMVVFVKTTGLTVLNTNIALGKFLSVVHAQLSCIFDIAQLLLGQRFRIFRLEAQGDEYSQVGFLLVAL